MVLRSIEIQGLRGFASSSILEPSQPNGVPGSGLSILVGSNNAGKSTIVEALRAIRQNQSPSFSEGRRNMASGGNIEIRAVQDDGVTRLIYSNPPGGSESAIRDSGGFLAPTIFVVPSRRV